MFSFQTLGAFVQMSLDVHGHLLVSEQHQMCFQWQKSDFHGPTRKIMRKKLEPYCCFFVPHNLNYKR